MVEGSRSYVDSPEHAVLAYRPVAKELARARSRMDVRLPLGLCLSGGGYRAALFHLGALRRLNELGILSRVDMVSSVSGGSILAGFLATRWASLTRARDVFTEWGDIEKQFRRITSVDLRTRALVVGAIGSRSAVRNVAGRLEEQKRVGPMLLRDLPADGPLFVFGATELVHRRFFTISRYGAGSRATGLYGMDDSWTVARAVAASACFPPVFAPMRPSGLIPRRDVGGTDSERRAAHETQEQALPGLRITDGGVLDNNGYVAMWNKCEDVLISDGGGSLPISGRPLGMLRTLGRYRPVQEFASKSSQKALALTNLTSGLHNGTLWGIRTKTSSFPNPSTHGGYDRKTVNQVISVIRTDLDHFSEPEAQILINHGYLLADAAITEHVSHLLPLEPPPLNVPFPSLFPLSDQALRGTLKRSHSRLPLGKRYFLLR